MRRSLLAAVCLFVSLTAGGCDLLNGLPFGMGGNQPSYLGAAAPKVQSVMYLGDAIGFTILQKPTMPTNVTIELSHLSAEASRSFELPFSELEAFTVPLEAKELPGYAEDAINRYRLSIALTTKSDGQMTDSKEFLVLRDRSILNPPSRPETLDPGLPEGSEVTVELLESLAKTIATTDWKGQGVTVTRHKFEDEAVAHFGYPEGTEVWAFDAAGEFPTFLLPAHLNFLGREALVTPNRVQVVLTRTNPVRVVGLMPFPAEP